jgi:hypothetical protein
MIIKKEADQILSYLEDTSNLRTGNATAVYIPKTEAEVLEVIKEARKRQFLDFIRFPPFCPSCVEDYFAGRNLSIDKLIQILYER